MFWIWLFIVVVILFVLLICVSAALSAFDEQPQKDKPVEKSQPAREASYRPGCCSPASATDKPPNEIW